MRKVKVLVSIASSDWSYTPGQVVELPDTQAETWIGSGLAEAVDTPVAPASAPKKGKAR